MPSVPAPLSVVIRPPGRPPYALELEQLTAHVRAARKLRMAFLDKMKQAANVVPDIERRAEADLDKLLARAAEVDSKRVKAFAVQHDRLNANHDALDRLEHGFDYLGNEERGSDNVTSKTSPNPAKDGWKEDGSSYHGTEKPKT